MFGLNVPTPGDAESVLRDLLPVIAPDIDPDRAVEDVLSSMKLIINICIAAKKNPDADRILASVIHSFIAVNRQHQPKDSA